ncbi:MAG: BatD family protein [Vicingaceae bacterium]
MTGKGPIIFLLLGFAVIFCLAIPVGVLAQPEFRASVSKTNLSVGERFRLEFTVNAGGDEFTPPVFDGFRILSGPNQSTSMQFINGRSSYSISYSYVLMALNEGDFEIPPASILVGKDVLASNSITIRVEASTANPPNVNQGKQNEQKSPVQNAGEDVFIVAKVSNTSPFVGEQITATYNIYYNQRVVQNYPSGIPSLNGFWSEDIDTQNEQPWTENVGGVKYYVQNVKKSLLIPQRSGELEIDPFTMDLVIQKSVQSRNRSIFDQFFGNYKNVEVVATSKPLKINVKPLPSGRPASFDGAVGKFKVSLKSDRVDVKTNDALNFTYTISGKGNLKLLNEPKINFPTDFEVYDPEVIDRVAINASGMSGDRLYTFLAIPRHNGEYKVEGPEFTYFDPDKATYVTLTGDVLNFDIAKGLSEEGNTVNFSGTNKQDVKFLGSDIRYIKTETVLLNVGYNFFGSWLFYLLWLLPIPVFFALYLAKQRIDSKRSDAAYMKRSRASKMAEKRLSNAKKLLGQGEDHSFYEAVFKALYGFFGDKFNLTTSDISKERIREVLSARSIEVNLIDQAMQILDQCEMARFAPTSDVDRENVYHQSVELLSDLQKSLK